MKITPTYIYNLNVQEMSYTFSLFLKHEMSYTSHVRRENKPQTFCPGWCLQPGQKAHVPPLARLAVGPGTKITYCPGPKGCQDKWPVTKACFVVVLAVFGMHV